MTGLIRSAGLSAIRVATHTVATGFVTSVLIAGPAGAQTAQAPAPQATPPATATPAPASPAPAATPEDYPPPEDAQAAPDIAPIPVTTLVTGAKLPLDKVGQTVTVLTTEDIERVGGADFTRVLALIPGVTYTRDGAQGSATQVHFRGSAPGDVLVTIDGVRMTDVAGISGGFDFGTLTTAGIDRIDILRGTNSVVWGSGAVGGVIALTTPETKGILASVEVGTHDNVAYNLGAGIRKDRYAMAFNVGYVADDSYPGERDDGPGGYHQWHLGARARYTLSDSLSVIATARYADGKESGNGFPTPLELAGDSVSALETEQFSGRSAAHFEKGGVMLEAGYAVSTTRRVYVDTTTDTAAQPTTTTPTWLGRSERADLTGSIKLPAGFAANFGADDEWMSYSSSYNPVQRARIDSAHALLGWYGPVATLTAGLRVDDHSQFGSHDSYSANASVKLLEGVRLHASYAEGFKSPTLYQLYSEFGNTALRPETVNSYDGGVEYSGDDGRIKLAATAYRRDTRNAIAFTGCTGSALVACVDRPGGVFLNVGVARADGVELEATLVPSAKLRLSALYSYDNARDRTPGGVDDGKQLAHSPHDAVTATVDWTSPFKGVVLSADLRVQSGSWDDAANTVRLGTSELTTLRASLPFGRFVDFYGRIENLFNDHTPTVAGYGVIGRGAFAGIRVRY
jgi:vitamin B12 transporter